MEKVFTDKLMNIQYGQDAEGGMWYRRGTEGEWIYAGNIERLEEAKFPLEFVSLLGRVREAREAKG